MSQTTAPINTATLQVNAGATVGPVSLGYYPTEGSKVCSTQYNFASTLHFYEDLQGLKAFGMETTIQGMWIDNSGNSQAVTIVIAGSNQQIIVPAYYQGIFPTFFSDNAAFYISVAAIGGVCKICLLNVPVNTAGVWSSTGTQTITGGGVNGSGVSQSPLLGTQYFYTLSIGTSGNTTIIPGVAGKRFFISSVFCGATGNISMTGGGYNFVSINDGVLGNQIFQTAPYLPAVAPTLLNNLTFISLTGLNVISQAVNQPCILYISAAYNGAILVTITGGYTTQTP